MISPIPVEPIAAFNALKAFTAALPKFITASFASLNWSIPEAIAIAL